MMAVNPKPEFSQLRNNTFNWILSEAELTCEELYF
jgi:hypothetical protein